MLHRLDRLVGHGVTRFAGDSYLNVCGLTVIAFCGRTGERITPEVLDVLNMLGVASQLADQPVVVLVRVVAEDYSDCLARITAPVAFCWGEQDTVVPPEVARRAAALAAHVVDVDVVAGAGHDVMFDAPERAGAAIDKVIAAVGQA